MKQVILTLAVFSVLTSCIRTQKYTSFVESKLKETATEQDIRVKNITFDLTELDDLGGQQVVSENLKTQFIPAIIYWQWDNIIKCKIDSKIIAKDFKQHFIRAYDSLGVSQKLQENLLEIKIEKIPNSFIYKHNGYAIPLLFADLEAIYPQEQDLIISFKVMKNNSVIKEGKVIAKNKDQAIKNFGKSPKKFTWLYIDQFNNNTKILTQEIAEQISKQL